MEESLPVHRGQNRHPRSAGQKRVMFPNALISILRIASKKNGDRVKPRARKVVDPIVGVILAGFYGNWSVNIPSELATPPREPSPLHLYSGVFIVSLFEGNSPLWGNHNAGRQKLLCGFPGRKLRNANKDGRPFDRLVKLDRELRRNIEELRNEKPRSEGNSCNL